MADLFYQAGYGGIHMLFSTGTGFAADIAVGYQPPDPCVGCLSAESADNHVPGFLVGDFNGDGLSDMFYNADDSNYLKVMLMQPPVSDLLATIKNGIGGVYTIDYRPSSSCQNTSLPFIAQVVSAITVDDGTLNEDGTKHAFTTSYRYADGAFDRGEREFRGFGRVKQTLPDGASTEAFFHQDAILKGLAYRKTTRDGSNKIYLDVANTYYYGSPPGSRSTISFVQLQEEKLSIYDGAGPARVLRTTLAYDDYANILWKHSDGDETVTGDEKDERTEYLYDSAHWIVSLPARSYTQDAEGVTKAETRFRYYTGTNLLYQKESTLLQGGANPIVTYTYDSFGNLSTVKDANGNPPANIIYDRTATYAEVAINPLGHISQAYYDYRFGKPTLKIDPNMASTTYEYDVHGRLVKVTGPYDTESTYGTASYDYQDVYLGRVGIQRVMSRTTQTSGTAATLWKQSYFDGLGREIKERRKGPEGKIILTETVYDSRGRVARKSLPRFEGDAPQWTQYTYDVMGRLTQTNMPDQTSSSASYLRGTTTLIDANGHKKVQERDAYGRLSAVKEYTGSPGAYSLYAVTRYQYDVLGNLTTVTGAGPALITTTMAYDSLSRKVSMTDPDMGTWSYLYDSNGNLVSQTDALGQTLTHSYDALNRIIQSVSDQGVIADYIYDEESSANSKGRLSRVRDQSGETRYDYDQMGRVLSTTIKVGTGTPAETYLTSSTYNALGQVKTITYPDGLIVRYGYDAASNLASVPGYATFSDYNALGQAGSITYPNEVTTQYGYNSANNRLESQRTFLTSEQGQTDLQSLQYGYDNVGNIVNISDAANGSQTLRTFSYDELNRLVTAEGYAAAPITYAYDKSGNITSNSQVGTYAYAPKSHAVIRAGTNRYTYDANGNMITRPGGSLTYDRQNRVSSITQNGVTANFTYNYRGERTKKEVEGSSTTLYIGNFYECTDGTCTRHIFAGGKRLASKTGATPSYYHADHLGGLNVLTNSQGQTVQTASYYPFGQTRNPGGTMDFPYKFTGKELDNATGLYYYGARYYDPLIGRFISPDSIVPRPGDPQTLNRYSYCRNNPLIYTDPTGHIFGIDDLLFGIIVGISATIGAVTNGIQSNWDLGATLAGAAIGAASAGVGMGVGSAVSSALAGVVDSAIASGAMSGAAGGFVAGGFAGVTNAAVFGANPLKGFLMGAGTGAVSGAAFGALKGYLSKPEGEVSPNNILDELARQRQQLYDANADYYGYTRGTYNPNLESSGATISDGQFEVDGHIFFRGHIEIGPGAFEYPSFLQTVGANESWKFDALLRGQWQIAGNEVLNRCELELAAEAWTINSRFQLDLTPLAVNRLVSQYNYYGAFIGAPEWQW